MKRLAILHWLLSLVLITSVAAQPTVTVTGTVPLYPSTTATLTAPAGYSSYQWTRNNVAIVGTAPTLTVSAAGYYRVKVTGGSGPDTSAPTRITVQSASGSESKNYTQTDVLLQEGVTTEAGIDLAQTRRNRAINYTDAMGRPVQQIAVQGSPAGEDIVQPIEYNAMGNQERQYLPYTGNAPTQSFAKGGFRTNYLQEQRTFYALADRVMRESSNLTYAETVYDNTPGTQVIEQGAAGGAWQIARDNAGQSTFQGHTHRTVARTNTANEVVLWTYQPGTNGATGTATFGAAPAQSLDVQDMKDEDGRRYLEYVNFLSQTVAKRVEAASGVFMVTNCAYDDFGHQVMVLSPEGVKRAVVDGETVNSTFLAKWAYLYQYDERGRTIGKKVPGRDWEYTVFDPWDRPVASQNGVQRLQNKWFYNKYDVLNRVVVTGQIVDTRSRQDLSDAIQAAVTAGTFSRYEIKGNTTIGTARVGYSLNQTFPSGVGSDNLFTVSYYDDYDYLDSSQSALQYEQEPAANDITSPTSPSINLVGKPTVSQVRVLNSTNWLTSVTYYDDGGRPLQAKTQNQLGGVSRMTYQYEFTNFSGKVLKTHLTHNISSGPTHTIRSRYVYKDNGQLDKLYAWFDRSSGTSNEVLLSQNEYNELGQIVDAKLGVSSSAPGTFLQSVDYRYNLRGWLTHINNRDLNSASLTTGVAPNADPDAKSDLFGLELKYDTDLMVGSATPRYNGSIAVSAWHSLRDDVLRSYVYQYDKADRLTAANYSAWNGSSWAGEKDDANATGRFTTSGIQYDLNGNILQLNRNGQISGTVSAPVFGQIDQLSYQYDGNKLYSVSDAAGVSAAPNDFEDLEARGAEYTYDTNGNTSRDINKGINVVYNELNLPTQIELRSGTIAYTYTATGQKLSRSYTRNSTSTSLGYTATSQYVDGFVYGQGPNVFVATPTGRAIYEPNRTGDKWVQEFHIRDQLGSLRLAFREKGTTLMRASMEQTNSTTEEEQFEGIQATRQYDPSHARTGDYAARLNAGQSQRMFGPSTSLTVKAGDSIHVEVYGRYDSPRKGGALPVVVPVAMLAETQSPGATLENGTVQLPKTGLLPKLFAGLAVAWTAVPHLFHKEEVPRASLKYDFYDQDSNLVASKVRYLEKGEASNWQRLALEFKADQDGYVQVSLQNGSAKDAWFDDLKVAADADMIVQENEYDPFGQNLTNIELVGSPDSKQQFSDKDRVSDGGLEWVEFDYRMYDPQIGRWVNSDPAAEATPGWSPYNYCLNNPVSHVDPDGRVLPVIVVAIIVGAAIGGVANAVANHSRIHSVGDLLFYAGSGAVVGGLAAGGAFLLPALGTGAVAGAFWGASSGAVGGLANGLYASKGNWGQAGREALIGGVGGAITGGLLGGASSLIKGRNFWSGFKTEGVSSFADKLKFIKGEFGGKALTLKQGFGRELVYNDPTGSWLRNGSTHVDDLPFAGAVDEAGNQLDSFAGNSSGTTATSSELSITFGQDGNQLSHVDRHLIKFGADVDAVKAAVVQDLRAISAKILPNRGWEGYVNVGGEVYKYGAFRLPNGTINVGKIHEFNNVGFR